MVAKGFSGTSATTIVLNGSPPITIPVGAAAGDVLTSDAVGNAAWVAGFSNVTGPFTVGGKLTVNGGTSTAGSAPALTPAFTNGAAAQLSDTTRDYTVLLQIGTPGTAFSLAIGPTSTPATTIFAGATPAAGQLLTIRLPASWYIRWAGTGTTLASQTAIGCLPLFLRCSGRLVSPPPPTRCTPPAWWSPTPVRWRGICCC